MTGSLRKAWRGFWCDPNGNAKLGAFLSEPVFWVVLVLKVLAGSLFASEYLSDLFIPFGDHFISHPLEDPYTAFLASHQPEVFPYPGFMLYVLVSAKALVSIFGMGSLPTSVTLFLYRLPLLAADLLILAILSRWLPTKPKKVLYLYWASPVIFYISYLHGQLDAIPIALLFLSLHALFKGTRILSGVFFGLGLAAKTHLVVCFPFFLIFLWRRQERFRDIGLFSLAVLIAFIIPNIPFIGSDAFFTMVFLNAAQKKASFAALSFSLGTEFYVILGAYILLIFISIRINSPNRDVFLMFLGFSFGVMLFFIVPMQGWYYWVIPLFAYFFVKAPPRQASLYFLLQCFYLFYFAVIPASDYQRLLAYVSSAPGAGTTIFDRVAGAGWDATAFVNIVYTFLQTTLAFTCAWIYRRGVRGYQKHKLTSQSFLIGISGDSGSGKTTLANSLAALFSPANVTVICGDDMHKWQRGDAKWQEMTHLDPRANELHHELNYIMAIRQHRNIKRRHYDHMTGKFTRAVEIRPKPIVVFEGLHTFYLKPARAMMDLKIFMKPDRNLLIQRKVDRDLNKRGYTLENILDSIAQRKDDSEKYIDVQEAVADIVVAMHLDGVEPGEKAGQAGSVWLEIIASNAFYFDPLLEDVAAVLGPDLGHFYDAEERQVIEFHKPVSLGVLDELCEKHLPDFQELGIYAPAWQEGYSGLLQLFIAWCIFSDYRRA